MDYVKAYKSFINSHYLASGVRITAGVVLPAVVLNYFDLLQVGIVVSLGAMCVSGTDNPGPIHHRRNGMLICTLLIFLVSITTDLAEPHDVMLGVFIFVATFVFSMIGVFGNRAMSIGVSALLIMVLNLSHHYTGRQIILNSLYVLSGGIWYTLLSLLLYRLRPYKLAQQALGDCILATSDYLRIRARFYQKNIEHDTVFQQLLEQQIVVHQQQELLRELLFKTRDIVKESTDTSRTLVLLFIDLVDLFERIMASYYDYEKLHKFFDDTDILERYRLLILELARELDDIGLAVKEGVPAWQNNAAAASQLESTRDYLEKLRDERRSPENIEVFISLRNILDSIEDLSTRIHVLQLYTSKDRKLLQKKTPRLEYEKFVTPHEDVTFELLKDNLSFKSNIFRHSLRVSIATLMGYVISRFLPLGHSYWILLTIIVILKPAYSLSKQRGYQRLLGTIGGALIGLLILMLVKNTTALFVIMLVLMLGTFSFIRTQYLVSVLFMTPYILLLFHLLYGGKTEAILADRVIDTAIGSAIAFMANFFLVPVWEHGQITAYLLHAIEDNMRYFNTVGQVFTGRRVATHEFKMARKHAFVSLANLSDAFSRMLSEPKSKQKNSRDTHQLVVLNHMLTSYTATLSSYVQPLAAKHASTDFQPVINATLTQLQAARAVLNREPVVSIRPDDNKPQLALEQRVRTLMEQRKAELRSGQLDTATRQTLKEFKPVADLFNFTLRAATDIKKICVRMVGES